MRKASEVVAELKNMKLAAAAKTVEDGVAETLTYTSFPMQHWTRIRTNNAIERLNREIRRRMFLARVIFREWPCNFFGFGSLSVPIFVPSFILPRDRASEKRPFSCLSR